MAYATPAHLVDYGGAERQRYPAIFTGVFREVPPPPQLGPERTEEIFLSQIIAVRSHFVQLEQAFTELRDQLSRLRLLPTGWDSYGAPSPNETSLNAAETALSTLRRMNVQPTGIMPSSDGGVGIFFVRGDRYAHVEFENSGDTWVLMYGSDEPPKTWQLHTNDERALREAWGRISASLQS